MCDDGPGVQINLIILSVCDKVLRLSAECGGHVCDHNLGVQVNLTPSSVADEVLHILGRLWLSCVD